MNIKDALLKNLEVWNTWLADKNGETRHRLVIENYEDPPTYPREFPKNLTLVIDKTPKLRSFSNCKFGENFVLELRDQDGVIDFSQCEFLGQSSFYGINFKKILFNNNNFRNEVDFRGCIFSNGVSFEDTQFHSLADFKESVFEKEANFRGSCFHERIDFSGARFNSSFILKDTKFKKEAPDFTKTKFEISPRLDSTIIEASEKLTLEGNPEFSARYRKLKQIAEANHDDEKKRLFFKAELQTKGYKKTRSTFWLTWFYEFFSDYGMSALRPFIIWFAVQLFFFLVYLKPVCNFQLASWPNCKIDNFWSALAGTFRNGFVIFANKKAEAGTSDQMLLMEYSHILISSVLMFLIILALRNRFKIS